MAQHENLAAEADVLDAEREQLNREHERLLDALAEPVARLRQIAGLPEKDLRTEIREQRA